MRSLWLRANPDTARSYGHSRRRTVNVRYSRMTSWCRRSGHIPCHANATSIHPRRDRSTCLVWRYAWIAQVPAMSVHEIADVLPLRHAACLSTPQRDRGRAPIQRLSVPCFPPSRLLYPWRLCGRNRTLHLHQSGNVHHGMIRLLQHSSTRQCSQDRSDQGQVLRPERPHGSVRQNLPRLYALQCSE